MISPLLAKLYGIILENKINNGQKVKVKGIKAKSILEYIIQQ